MNCYEILDTNGEILFEKYNYACFSKVLKCVGNEGDVIYYCAKHDDFGERDRWYIKSISEFLPFEIISENDKEIIFKVKLFPKKAKTLTILTFLRYVDKNELKNTNVLDPLNKIYKLSKDFEPYYAIMLGAATSTSLYGHDFFPAYSASAYSAYLARRIIQQNKLVEKLNDESTNTVYDICSGSKVVDTKSIFNLINDSKKLLEAVLEK